MALIPLLKHSKTNKSTRKSKTLHYRATVHAKRGRRVLPLHTIEDGHCSCELGEKCTSPGKHPRTQHGIHDATTDLAIIDEWFEDTPRTNIGVATGVGSGIIILDIDPRNDGDGTLKQLERDLGPLPETVEVKTGGGGTHFYFRCPEDFTVRKDSAGKTLGKGIDVLGEGAFAVAPGSLHFSGAQYRWAPGRAPASVKIAPLPHAWLEKLKPEHAPKRNSANPPPIVSVGDRNNALISFAGKLQHDGLPANELRAAVLAENLKRCDPPLGEAEIEHIVRSALKYPAGPQITDDRAEKILQSVLEGEFGGGQNILYLPEGRFWAFDGKRWKPLSVKWIEGKVLAWIRRSGGSGNTSALIGQVIRLAQAQQAIDDDRLGFLADPQPVINCANGEVWIHADGSLDFRPHSARSYLRNCLDVRFDPAAQCPEFDVALRSIFQEARSPAEMVRHWEELTGYLIQPSRSIALITVLLGDGANGKTSLVDTWTRLLGDDLVTAMKVQDLERSRFVIGSLLGKLVLVDDDVKAGIRLPDGELKKISERKTLTGEVKYGSTFNFTCLASPILLCNNQISLADVSHGLLRRLMVIPFDHRFKEGKDLDRTLFPKIWKDEMSGILNRALEGLARLIARGWQFSEPRDVKAAKKAWLRQANPLPDFLQECCQRDPNARIAVADLYQAYIEWAERMGITMKQQRAAFQRNLEHLEFAMKKGNVGVMALGLKLKPQRRE